MGNDCEFIIVWTTLPHDADAARLARALIGDRLAACVTTQAPVRSVYRWNGSVKEDQEQLLTIKTTRARQQALWQRLRELHPYEVPEFVVTPVVDGSRDYLDWIRNATASTEH